MVVVFCCCCCGKVYHSSFVDEGGVDRACGCPLLPLKSHIKGPAPVSNQGFQFTAFFFFNSSVMVSYLRFFRI